MEWYDALDKPAWTPRPETIGTIWSLLYPIILGVNIYVWVKYFRKELPLLVLLPFAINLAANIAFTPIQFGLRSLNGALVCIVIVWVTIIWSMVAVWPYSRVAAMMFVPYLIWVSLATILQTEITFKN